MSAAFAKGSVLLDGSDGRNYMVHASRRDGPGRGEVPAKDTDVSYVLEGKSTFVTGGTLVDGKTTVPDEIRGSGIQGGETRQSPNDLVHKSGGALYFTDPPFGLPKFFDDPRKELPYSGVFRVSPDGKQIQLLTTELKGSLN